MNTADDMFRPPVNRAMRVLDRSFFQKTIPTSAARVHNIKDISKCRKQLEQNDEMLKMDDRQGIANIVSDPEPGSKRKCILLQPKVKPDDPLTWSATLRELCAAREVALIPWALHLNYDHWTFHEIIEAILPEGEEAPRGFNSAGHIAHFNLRDAFAPYKQIIGQVALDKNPSIKTVINKIDDVGEESEYRTFAYELLAGKPDMHVELSDQGCSFRFDYSKVYWNTKLNTEHQRLVSTFKPGDAVCDVMAGIGPFAVPAGKKRVFVWANDLNPDSFACLQDAITRNKVSQFVRAFNEDGRKFIRSATNALINTTYEVTIKPKVPRSATQSTKNGRTMYKISDNTSKADETYIQPRTFSHFIMNLPATALTFLHSFTGLYAGHQDLFSPHTETLLPTIHVYCFSRKNENADVQKAEICADISRQLGHCVSHEDREVQIEEVRAIAPNKKMFCASFRLPAQVAFRVP